MFWDEVPDPPPVPSRWAASYQGAAWEDGWQAGYAAANGIEWPQDEEVQIDGPTGRDQLL